MDENKQNEPVAWPCKIIESDFEQDTITLKMKNKDYFVSGGTFWLSMSKQNPAPAVAQEPVHFRAVLCGEQQDQAFGVVPKVVGFVDKKAAEQFILEKRDFQGWRYNLEPLYTEAPAVAVNERVGVIERYGYQALFNAIAEATKIEGGQIGVSVIAFAKSLEAAIAHRDAQPAVAVDDQLLDTLENIEKVAWATHNVVDKEGRYKWGLKTVAKMAGAAIAAAEAEKAKGGV